MIFSCKTFLSWLYSILRIHLRETRKNGVKLVAQKLSSKNDIYTGVTVHYRAYKGSNCNVILKFWTVLGFGIRFDAFSREMELVKEQEQLLLTYGKLDLIIVIYLIVL